MAWLQSLAEWMVGWAQTPVGPAALFLLAFAESSVFPLPPDLLLLALNFITPERSLWYAAICTAGSTLGGGLGYAIGRWGGRPLLDRLMSQDKILGVQRAFQRYDVWAVAIAGFTPIPYKLFTIAGGVFHIAFWRFLLVSFLSRGARFLLVSLAVLLFGEQARRLVEERFELFTLVFVALLLGGYLVVRLASRSLGPRREPSDG